MQVDFFEVLITVFALVLLAVPGFILKKCKLLPENATKTLTTVLLFVSQAFLTFMSFQKTPYRDDILVNMLVMAGIALLGHLVMIGIVCLLFLKKGGKDKKINVIKFASVFGNCGFLGLPFLQTMFEGQPEIVIYGAVIVAVFNLLSWTVGIFLITGDKKFISLKKAVINPPFLALLVSLPLFIILKTPLAEVGTGTVNFLLAKLSSSMNFLADMVTPLSMIILGIRLAEMDVKRVFTNKWVYISSGLKLVAMPLVAFAIVSLIPAIALEVRCALFFTFCMPTATQTLLFSEQYDGEPFTASSAVLLNTVLSIATIPLMSLFLNLL
ncbi:MAG: AEC family transporter [Clostridia bacterium]|nr:AEC family transporter [Clostridia bacterium]